MSTCLLFIFFKSWRSKITCIPKCCKAFPFIVLELNVTLRERNCMGFPNTQKKMLNFGDSSSSPVSERIYWACNAACVNFFYVMQCLRCHSKFPNVSHSGRKLRFSIFTKFPYLTLKVTIESSFLQAQSITTITVSSIGVLTNGLYIIVIVVDPLHLLKRGPWITILSLSIADLTASLTCLMLEGLFELFKIKVSFEFQTFVNFFCCCGVIGSTFHLASLTIQTYIITKYPICSRHVDTKTNLYNMLCSLFCCLWLSYLWNGIHFYWKHFGALNIFFNYAFFGLGNPHCPSGHVEGCYS